MRRQRGRRDQHPSSAPNAPAAPPGGRALAHRRPSGSDIVLPGALALLLLLLLLLLSIGLAGCIGGSSPTPQASPDEDPAVVTDPSNYTYVDNASFATGGHVHDYWDGQDQVVVVDRTEATGQLSILASNGEPDEVARFRPEPGHVIPQGTATVTVTISWTERYAGMLYEDPELWVQTAGSHELEPVTDVSSGQTVTIETTNADNDLPHRRLSGWVFVLAVRPVAPADTIWFQAEVTMEVVAERGLPLPVFPAHPDLWNGRTRLPLLEDTTETFVWAPDTPVGGICSGAGCDSVVDGDHRPDDGAIVPYDADWVMVELTPLTDSPTRVGLSYHGADTWEFARLEPTEVDARTRIYVIPVTEETADGPYNEQSLWRFRPYVSDPAEDGVYAGAYTMQAWALEGEAPGSAS